MRTRTPILLLAALAAPRARQAQPGVDRLPVLNWPVPREWLNVQDGCAAAVAVANHGSAVAAAVGNGVADDTVAIRLTAYARQQSTLGKIDEVGNLRNANVFVYHGSNDHTYLNGSMKKTADFYSAFIGEGGSVTRHINEVFSDHAIPTDDDWGSNCGGGSAGEGVESCGYDGAGATLQAIIGGKLQSPDPEYDGGRLRTFDQRPYQRSSAEPRSWSNGLTPTGLLYVPPGCDAGETSGSACRLVLLFHGCYGYCSLDSVRHNGLLKHAATNKLVVLAPQVGSLYVGAGPANGTVQTCFDNYGGASACSSSYTWCPRPRVVFCILFSFLFCFTACVHLCVSDTGANYCLKEGTQNVGVRRMVQCILGVGPCPVLNRMKSDDDEVSTPSTDRRGTPRSYLVYDPTVHRGFVVDAAAPGALLQENHDASIQWFDDKFIATWNGARNASFLKQRQLNRFAWSTDGHTWTPAAALHEAGCDSSAVDCNQWQPSMAVIKRPAKAPSLWVFWCQYVNSTIQTANFAQSAVFMSTMESGAQSFQHRRWDGSWTDTSGAQWRVFPTQNPVQLVSGRVVVPVSLLTQAKGMSATNSVVYTDDFGLSFKLSPGTPQKSATSCKTWEPDVWEEPSRHNRSSLLHMLVRCQDYGVASRSVLQHSVSTNQGETWTNLEVVPIESVPNRPGVAVMRDTGAADEGGNRVLMLDSDWSPTSPLTSVEESCRFNLAMFLARHGDGPRLTAGFGFTGDEDFVMYPQWTVQNGSLIVVYSQGMVQRSIKYAQISPLPASDSFYVWPRSKFVGSGGMPPVVSRDSSGGGQQLRLSGGSAGLDIDPTNRSNGDSVHITLAFRVGNRNQSTVSGSTAVVVTVGDADAPARVSVDAKGDVSASIGAKNTKLGYILPDNSWNIVTVHSGGSTTNVSMNHVTVTLPHSPSNTWVYLGEGFSSLPSRLFFHKPSNNSAIVATNFSLLRANAAPANAVGPGCSEIPRPSEMQNAIVESCFQFAASREAMAGFWVYYQPHPSFPNRTRCCPKSSFNTTNGWAPNLRPGAFFELTEFKPTSGQGFALNVDYDISQLSSSVDRRPATTTMNTKRYKSDDNTVERDPRNKVELQGPAPIF
eukprot:COSAG05_NODE_1745_length_4157_cov_2.148842_2_plen_1109_part_00